VWLVSRICEEFTCLPDAARQALEDDCNGSIFQMLDFRSLANAKARIDSARKGDHPTDAAAARYTRLQMELVGRTLGIATGD